MKKTGILFLFVAGLAMFSCKKIYTCDCTLTDHYDDGDTTYTLSVKNTSTAYSEKMTKTQARAACDNEGAAAKSNLDNIGAAAVAAGGEDDDTYSSACTIK